MEVDPSHFVEEAHHEAKIGFDHGMNNEVSPTDLTPQQTPALESETASDQIAAQQQSGGGRLEFTPPMLATSQAKRKRGRPPSAGRPVVVRQDKDEDRSNVKRPRGRPRGSKNKMARSQSVPGKPITSLGDPVTHQKPLVLNIQQGEDVTDRLKRFCDENQCSLVVQAATGTLSEATLTQQCTGHGVILKNTFTILSLSGALIRSGPESTVAWFLTASLAAPDGGVVGGQVAGPLSAASSVIVVIAYWNDQVDQSQGLQLNQLADPSSSIQHDQFPSDNIKQEVGEEIQQKDDNGHMENIENHNNMNEIHPHDQQDGVTEGKLETAEFEQD